MKNVPAALLGTVEGFLRTLMGPNGNSKVCVSVGPILGMELGDMINPDSTSMGVDTMDIVVAGHKYRVIVQDLGPMP